MVFNTMLVNDINDNGKADAERKNFDEKSNSPVSYFFLTSILVGCSCPCSSLFPYFLPYLRDSLNPRVAGKHDRPVGNTGKCGNGCACP